MCFAACEKLSRCTYNLSIDAKKKQQFFSDRVFLAKKKKKIF